MFGAIKDFVWLLIVGALVVALWLHFNGDLETIVKAVFGFVQRLFFTFVGFFRNTVFPAIGL